MPLNEPRHQKLTRQSKLVTVGEAERAVLWYTPGLTRKVPCSEAAVAHSSNQQAGQQTQHATASDGAAGGRSEDGYWLSGL